MPQRSMCSVAWSVSLGADPAPLVVGVDPDDVDHAHAFVERIQRDCRRTRLAFPRPTATKTSRSSLRQLDPDRLGLTGAPVRVQAEEDLVPENLPKRVEDRRPRSQGERDHRIEVSFAEFA